MARKVIIMTAVGLVSFAGAFVFAWLTSSSPSNESVPSKPPAADATPEQLPQPDTGAMSGIDMASGPAAKSMTGQQLKDLVQSIREKMREYDNKLQGLKVQEQRVQVAQNVLKEDIENLNSLRVELASTVASLKTERDKLLKSRLEIERAEKINLVSIAATYDKMDPSSAGKIMMNMCGVGQTRNTEPSKAYNSFDDAVKILYYMTERTKANLLAEVATSEPALAASLCKRLKQIVERE